MGLNDEREKLRQAKTWLTGCDVSSQQFKAAWEHVTHLLDNAVDPDIRAEARKIADMVIGRNRLN